MKRLTFFLTYHRSANENPDAPAIAHGSTCVTKVLAGGGVEVDCNNYGEGKAVMVSKVEGPDPQGQFTESGTITFWRSFHFFKFHHCRQRCVARTNHHGWL